MREIDVGFDPPLGLQGAGRRPPELRRVSVRWFGATLLTGISGAALLAIAIIGVREQTDDVVAPPQLEGTARAVAPDAGGVTTARRSDRLVRTPDPSAVRHHFRAPVTVQSGDRAVIRVRGFHTLATPLALTGDTFADQIPPFNPLRLLTGSDVPETLAPAPPRATEGEGDATLVQRPIHGAPIAFSSSVIDDAGALEQVRAAVAATRPQVPALPPQLLIARPLSAPVLPGVASGFAPLARPAFVGIDVRTIEENVTRVARTTHAQPFLPEPEVVATLKRGDTAESVLRSHGVGAAEARAAAGAMRRILPQEGQRMRLLLRTLDDRSRQVQRVLVIGDSGLLGGIALTDRQQFVEITRDVPTARAADDDDDDGAAGRLTLYQSLYETALRNDVPRPIVDQLVRVLSSDSDIDFQRRVAGGDFLSVLFAAEEDGVPAHILHASLTAAGETKSFYRFVNPDDQSVDFFDEHGRSARRFLLRKPVVNAEMRSGFGMRRHPILGYYRMHTGVDWANGRSGEPVLAAGSGTIIKAGWDSGYGRRVEIQHANGYVTTYSHLAGFGRGIEEGARVRQGQIIGFIGSSGLSTGPHLHYEVIVNDNYVDPMRIRLPRGRELDGRLLAIFQRERRQVDDLRQRSRLQQVGELIQR